MSQINRQRRNALKFLEEVENISYSISQESIEMEARIN